MLSHRLSHTEAMGDSVSFPVHVAMISQTAGLPWLHRLKGTLFLTKLPFTTHPPTHKHTHRQAPDVMTDGQSLKTPRSKDAACLSEEDRTAMQIHSGG